nr:hypothetical protein [Moritella viscosa]SHO03615.1 SARP family transcriptional regulator [Moritella viscosa]
MKDVTAIIEVEIDQQVYTITNNKVTVMKCQYEYQKLINSKDYFDVDPDEAIDIIYKGDNVTGFFALVLAQFNLMLDPFFESCHPDLLDFHEHGYIRFVYEQGCEPRITTVRKS